MSKKTKIDYEFRAFESGKKKGRHLRLAEDMRESKAWKDLNYKQIAVYVEMKAKYNGTNEDDISFTYVEAKECLKMDKTTFTKSIDSLIEHGFIYIVRQGGLNKQCTIYGLSGEWRYFGTSAFKVKKKRVARKSTKKFVLKVPATKDQKYLQG